MTKTSFLTLLLLVFASFLVAQNIVKGTLTDTKGNPIIYAHVFLKNHQSIGTVTNEMGDYLLTSDEEFNTDTLVCSILGYETLFTPLQDVYKAPNLVMDLLPFQMEEVTIVSDEYLRHLLRSAIQNIPQNYPAEKNQTKVYFQDYTISNGTHSELIEADLTIVNDGYDKIQHKKNVYLNQIRKTDDNRNLTDHLQKVFKSKLNHRLNPLLVKSFSKFRFKKNTSLLDFENEINSAELSLYAQNVMGIDTLISIKIIEPFLMLNLIDSETGKKVKSPFMFTLVTINKSDFAIVEIQFGDIFSEKNEWKIYKYRKIDEKYFPVFAKRISSMDLKNTIRKYYNVKTLYFYDFIVDQKDFIKCKGKNKLNEDSDFRTIKYKYDAPFWSTYSHSLALPTTEGVLQSLHNQKDLHKQFTENQKKRKRKKLPAKGN